MRNIQSSIFNLQKQLLVVGCLLLVTGLCAQTAKEKLQAAYQQFESDSQLRHAISSLYVINAKTGEVVFDKNSQIGLAGASTQKIITAATAFELLRKDYRYKTEFWQPKTAGRSRHKDLIIIKPSGDPTFGSWRYSSTQPDSLFKLFRDSGWNSENCVYHIYKNDFEAQQIPDSWIWQDVGNYYGAGTGAFNWRENQFDIVLTAGKKIGDPVQLTGVDPSIGTVKISNQLTTGQPNSGDNAYYYFFYGNNAYYGATLKGTIPLGAENFKISAAIANPYYVFTQELIRRRGSINLGIQDEYYFPENKSPDSTNNTLIYTHYSPSLDSIIYWFLKRSINLYGEALVKTFAYEKKGFGSTDSGVVIVKDFWKQKGLDPEEINIKDGSGLSPQNRITTHAQVEILKYAKQQSWFPYFFDALPEFNNMKMKSGTINDVKGFCGYHTSADGNEYIFSFLVNNYSGRSSAVVNKMYKVLDLLK